MSLRVGGLSELVAERAGGAELALLQDAFENMQHGVCMFDHERRLVLCNSRYAAVLQVPVEKVRPGMTAREVIQLSVDAGYHSADAPVEQLERNMFANLRAPPEKRAHMQRGGRTYAVQSVETAQGNLLVTFQDITQVVLAQAALSEGEARLRAILDSMPDCVKIFDRDARIVYLNPKGLALMQAPDLETFNASGHKCLPPEHMTRAIDVHTRVLAGEAVEWEYEIIGMEGRRVSVEAHAVPFDLPDGTRAHLSITRDVTQRKLNEQALRDSEERLRLVQEASGLADFEMDADGVSICSDRFFAQCGLPVPADNKLTYEEWSRMVHPDDYPAIHERIQQAFKEEDTFGCQFRIIRADTGEVRWIGSRMRVERDAQGKRVRTLGARFDITETKHAEDALRASGERLRLVQEATGLADFEADENGLTDLSPSFIAQVGLPPGTRYLTHEGWMQIVHPDDRERLTQMIEASIHDDEAFSCEFRILRPDNGELRWISSRTKIQRDGSGRPLRSIGAHLDITERKLAEEELRESEERFRLAAEAAGLGVWDYDAELDRREWSGRLRDIFGISEDSDATLAVAEACIDPTDRARFMRWLHQIRDGGLEKFEDTFRIRRADDQSVRWVSINGWRTHKADNQLRRIIMTVRDVTTEKTAEERVRWTATHDALTRLANRTLFQEKLEQAIHAAGASGAAVGLLLLDMDHFKQINDTLGHDAGDKLLKMFADRLRAVVRPEDTVARFGGDEFAIVVPGLKTEQSLLDLSRSLQERLREPFVHAGRILDCRASIGGSLFPLHGRTMEDLLKNADMALYAAKAAGRGVVSLFEPQMRDGVQRRAAMVQLARNALREDRILPYYQPKLDLRTGAVIGFEALLRWRTSRGRIRMPSSLEAAFDDLEVAAEISDRMVQKVIADMRGWLDKGVEFQHVAVNASAAELRRDDFAERVLEQLRRSDISPRCLQLEVTETVFLGRGAEFVHRALALLSSRGVKIALDDFGTGYASLRHLKQFPVDIIKIDRSFVRDLEADAGNEAIVRAVINLGKSLGIRIVAEGIETQSQADRLVELECDFGQGYLFSKAVAASRVPALVPNSRRQERDGAGASRLRLVANRR